MRGFLMGWGVRILIIAAIAIGALIFRDRLSSNAGDLKTGDCFDDPAAAATEIEDVQHQPCTDPHDNEVLVVTEHFAPKGQAYPSDPDFEGFVGDRCVTAFQPYTGRDPDAEEEIGLGWYVPTSEGWGDGDRKVICYLYRLDSTQLTAPLKIAS